MSHKWSKGYVSDLTYSHGYYHELAPSFLRFFLLQNGFANTSQNDDYSYCELGYGQGVSANLHAAANPRGRCWGTDFNPDHALFAQCLARQAGVEATWMARGFEELLDDDLPSFDFITLHGVWSWIDASARHAVVEFIRRRLKLGGIVYMSYNVMPGWATEKPLRDLMWLHTELAGGQGESTASRIQGAIAYADRLRKGNAAYFEQFPRAGQMLDDMSRDDRHVVAHEYFNRSWHIAYFADLAQSLEAAGLSFACSVHKSDLVGEVALRRQACRLPAGDMNAALRETTNDFLLHRRFRRDVFVRGAARLQPAEQEAMLREVGLVLLRPADTIGATVQTPYGQVALDRAVLGSMLEQLAGASEPVTLGRIIDATGHPASSVFAVAGALVAQSQAFPVFAGDASCASQARARHLNRAIAQRARIDDTLRYLASPLTGHGLEVNHLHRLFLLGLEEGVREPADLAAFADPWAQALAPGEGRGQALIERAQHFNEAVVPLWRRLGLLQGEGA